MTNLNPQQFEQLPLFMSAREIKNRYEATDVVVGDDRETRSKMWGEKLQQATASGHRQHIAEHGVEDPIPLVVLTDAGKTYRQQAGGHHRVAVMGADRPDALMPVIHHPSYKTLHGTAYPYS